MAIVVSVSFSGQEDSLQKIYLVGCCMTALPFRDPVQLIVKSPELVPEIKINSLQYKYWELLLLDYRDQYDKNGSLGEHFCYIAKERLFDHLGFEPNDEDIKRDLDAIRRQPINFFVLETDKTRGKIGCGLISRWYVSPLKIGVVFPSYIRKEIEQLNRFQFDILLLNFSKIPCVKNEQL